MLIGLGAAIWRTPTRVAVLVAASIGAAMLVLPLALSYPSKASDAAKVAAVGRVALSARAAAGAQTANRLIDGMVTQVDERMIPSVARRLRVTTSAFETTLAREFPAVAKGLAAWPSIRPGAIELVRRQVASVPDAAQMNGLDFTPLPWLIIGPGIALLLATAVSLATAARRERARERFGALRPRGAGPS